MIRYFRSLFSLPGRIRQRTARRGLARQLSRRSFSAPAGAPVLNFAGILGEDHETRFISGGAVKLLHLNEAFTSGVPFNILYLVSSALPEHVQPYIDWAKGNGAIVVLNQNGVAYPAWAGSSSDSINGFLSIPLKQADYILYQSKFSEDASRALVWNSAAPSSILYNCVDTDAFKPLEAPRSSDGPWKILVIGSHWESYRVVRALELLRRCRDTGMDVELIVAGPIRWPNGEADFLSITERLGLDGYVTRIGKYSQADAPGIYQKADILLHLKYKDPCPTVPIEAMACGLPVLGSATGGMPELVGSDGGRLIPLADSWDELLVPDVDSLFAALTDIMDNYDSISAQARNRALKLFSNRGWVDTHRGIFMTLLTKKGLV